VAPCKRSGGAGTLGDGGGTEDGGLI
jgi:hypothetical protein